MVLLELLLQRTVEPAVIISAPPRLPRLIECNLIKQADQRFRLAGGGGTYDVRDAACGLPEDVRLTICAVCDDYAYLLAK